MDEHIQQDQLKEAMAAGGWYAACETGHPFWAGSTQITYKAARKDATDHDTEKHGGSETAVVLQSPNRRGCEGARAMLNMDEGAESVHGPKFVVSIEDLASDESHCKVRLCTGTLMTVPSKLLKSASMLGKVESNGVSSRLAVLEVDVTSDAGKLIVQMAAEIERLAQEISHAKEASLRSVKGQIEGLHVQEKLTDALNPAAVSPTGVQRVSVPVSGYACQVNLTNYTPNRDIAGYAFAGAQNCQVARIDRVTSRWLRIYHGALNGSICGTQYSGKIFIDIQWA